MDCKNQETLKTVLENIKPTPFDIQPPDATVRPAHVLVIPNGMKAVSTKPFLEENRTRPERRNCLLETDTLGSFIEMVNRFKSDDTVIFARSDIQMTEISATMMAIFDFDPAGPDNTMTGNMSHRCAYQFPLSQDFAFWISNNGKLMGQNEFACMLEDRINDMANATDDDVAAIANLRPKFAAPIEILELSRTLEVYASERVVQGYRPQSGERTVKFTSEHNGADGKPISIPDFFVIHVPIFYGAGPVRILVRLRYRKDGESIKWAYELYRVDRVFEKAFTVALGDVMSLTNVPLFIGGKR